MSANPGAISSLLVTPSVGGENHGAPRRPGDDEVVGQVHRSFGQPELPSHVHDGDDPALDVNDAQNCLGRLRQGRYFDGPDHPFHLEEGQAIPLVINAVDKNVRRFGRHGVADFLSRFQCGLAFHGISSQSGCSVAGQFAFEVLGTSELCSVGPKLPSLLEHMTAHRATIRGAYLLFD
jgi:hypothetical protein